MLTYDRVDMTYYSVGNHTYPDLENANYYQ